MKSLLMYARKRRVLSRYRAAIRGSRRLALDGKPFLIRELIGQLEMINLTTDRTWTGGAYKDFAGEKWEIRLRQLLMDGISVVGFCGLAGIGGNSAAVAAIPREWAEHLSNNGVEFDIRKCERKFRLRGIGAACKGYLVFVKLLSQFLFFCLDKEQYIWFRGLTRENLPSIENKKTANLISWYRNAKLVNSSVENIVVELPKSEASYAAVGIQSERWVYPKLPDIYSWLKFLVFGIRTGTTTLLAVVCGETAKGFLLKEALEARYFKLVKRESLAREYLVSNSSWYDKPLWMDAVELQGSRVTCYYYSTNIEGTIIPGHPSVLYGMSLMRWNNFYVWDQCHEEFFRRYRPSANYLRVGYIDMADDGSRISESASMFRIAVFDVSPMRRTLLASLGLSAELEYYSERLFKIFNSDIAHLAKNVPSVTILRKQKRKDLNIKISAGMRSWLRNLIKVSGITDVHYGVGASRLIDECDGVISMPFTSTAIIAQAKSKPTIYYDPTGKAVASCQRGIPILQSRDELIQWVQKILKESNRVARGNIDA